MTGPRLQYVLENCNVSSDLGNLPPELCGRVALQNRADVTVAFHLHIADFISNNQSRLRSFKAAFVEPWDGVSELFATPCTVECRNRASSVDSVPWRGAIATVCRVSFPEIGASYALKVFQKDRYFVAHGPWYEIPMAFAAHRAESKDNNPVYMASLGPVKYMLSAWAGEEKDVGGAVRKNKYEIFITQDREMHCGNWRGGRRIDYGDTRRTLYGVASYRVRKMYRKIMNIMANNDAVTLRQMAQNASVAAPAAYQDFEKAIGLAFAMTCKDIYKMIGR